MSDMRSEDRRILVITADAVKETGTVSFRFMIDADPERKLSPMPQKYGWVWWRRDEDSRSFNVFESGKGLVVGGGFAGHDTPEWEKEQLDAIPSCTLLMDIDVLPWWKELAGKHGNPRNLWLIEYANSPVRGGASPKPRQSGLEVEVFSMADSKGGSVFGTQRLKCIVRNYRV